MDSLTTYDRAVQSGYTMDYHTWQEQQKAQAQAQGQYPFDGNSLYAEYLQAREDALNLREDETIAPALERAADRHSALTTQVSGDHYKDKAIQPVEYIHANGLGFCEGCVVKYVSRWRDKGGIADLEKAKHFIDMLIELESRDE